MKKRLFILAYFLSPLILISILYFSIPGRYANFELLMTMILGASAYTWLSFQFMLSARPKFIERSFGMDRLYRFHGLIAFFILTVAFFHRQFIQKIFPESLKTQIGTAALIIFISISVLSILLMSPSILLKVKPIKWVKKTIEKLTKVRYQHLRLIHNLTIVAFILMNIHLLMTGNAKLFPLVKASYITYFVIFSLFYIYHKFLKKWILSRNKFIVSRIVKESPNMWSITMTQQSKRPLKYTPGQFGFFTFYQEGLKAEEHPFSISSAPHQYPQISITVKELGDYTKKIGSVLEGSFVTVDGPYGKFSHRFHQDEEAVVFIAGGVGITPILSMLRHMTKLDKDQKALLIWGMNTQEDYIIRDEIEQMQLSMKNLIIVPVIAFDPQYNGEKGFIDQEKITRLFQSTGWDLSTTGFYVCGPGILMDNTIKNLKLMNVNKKHIHYEKFSL